MEPRDEQGRNDTMQSLISLSTNVLEASRIGVRQWLRRTLLEEERFEFIEEDEPDDQNATLVAADDASNRVNVIERGVSSSSRNHTDQDIDQTLTTGPPVTAWISRGSLTTDMKEYLVRSSTR